MLLILVRHGRAGRKDRWDGPDASRPLDTRGRGQAKRLVDIVMPHHPTMIVSSPYRRCLETMAPLATATGLEVERAPALAPDAPVIALSLIRELGATDDHTGVVLCTHGEVMGAVLTEMAHDDGLQLKRRPPGLKGCAWLLDMRHGKLTGARYVAPR